MATLLVIDDNETLREGVQIVGERLGHHVLSADSGEAGLRLFAEHEVDLVVTDLKMDGLDGLAVLRKVKERAPDVAVMIMTAFGTVDSAVEAMKEGAHDFITKPFSTDALRLKLSKALEWRRLERENSRLRATRDLLTGASDPRPRPANAREFQGMVGYSEAIKSVFDKLQKIGPTESNVAISGESGTGKELVADAIHRLSRRAAGPLIKVNCGALPESLLESELFGHERGAFTGAIKRKLGRFELADGGTLFLDEIGEVSPAVQVKLLRVLQEQTFTRVGGEKEIKVDVRVVSATHKDLNQEVAQGRFREDLFYRLQIVPLRLPPLRERTDDIIPLAEHFIDKLRRRTNPEVLGISGEACSRLRCYHYPGNVRELENIIEQALVFANPPQIEVHDLPPQVSGAHAEAGHLQLPAGNLGLNEFLEAAERQMILSAYEASGGIKTETARRLKIKTSALYYKLEKYGIGVVAGRELGNESEE